MSATVTELNRLFPEIDGLDEFIKQKLATITDFLQTKFVIAVCHLNLLEGEFFRLREDQYGIYVLTYKVGSVKVVGGFRTERTHGMDGLEIGLRAVKMMLAAFDFGEPEIKTFEFYIKGEG